MTLVSAENRLKAPRTRILRVRHCVQVVVDMSDSVFNYRTPYRPQYFSLNMSHGQLFQEDHVGN